MVLGFIDSISCFWFGLAIFRALQFRKRKSKQQSRLSLVEFGGNFKCHHWETTYPGNGNTFSVLLNVRPLTESKTEKPDIVFSVPNTPLNSRGISVCCILVENVDKSSTMNYPKKPGFNLHQSRYCAYTTYSLKTWFLKVSLFIKDIKKWQMYGISKKKFLWKTWIIVSSTSFI